MFNPLLIVSLAQREWQYVWQYSWEVQKALTLREDWRHGMRCGDTTGTCRRRLTIRATARFVNPKACGR